MPEVKRLLSIIVILFSHISCFDSEANDAVVIKIGRFSDSSLEGWKEKSFSGNTDYQFVKDQGITILRAESNAAASGLFYEKEIDLLKTPIINWQWKVDKIINGVTETTKQGDDYPARVYVIFSGGLFFWKTRAINYVWSNNQEVGTIWPNAFTDNARMIALRTGTHLAGKWVNEKRNIREDYKNLFGEDIETADAIAIMTDTDNSGSNAVANYGDIYLSSHYDYRDVVGRATQDAKADDYRDVVGRATQDAKADDYRDVVGRATQDAKAE